MSYFPPGLYKVILKLMENSTDTYVLSVVKNFVLVISGQKLIPQYFLSYVSTDTGSSIRLNGFYIFSQSELIGPGHFKYTDR